MERNLVNNSAGCKGSGSPSSPTTPYPEGATIGVPIETSHHLLYLNLFAYCRAMHGHCRSAWSEIVGIYRVPGNTAAVTALTEAVNKGVELVHP